jgi:hypothetical protein
MILKRIVLSVVVGLLCGFAPTHAAYSPMSLCESHAPAKQFAPVTKAEAKAEKPARYRIIPKDLHDILHRNAGLETRLSMALNWLENEWRLFIEFNDHSLSLCSLNVDIHVAHELVYNLETVLGFMSQNPAPPMMGNSIPVTLCERVMDLWLWGMRFYITSKKKRNDLEGIQNEQPLVAYQTWVEKEPIYAAMMRMFLGDDRYTVAETFEQLRCFLSRQRVDVQCI